MMTKETSCQALTINIVEESKNQKHHPKNNDQHYKKDKNQKHAPQR
jgi:hypothetical protein